MTTENAVYRCEELERSVSVYDMIDDAAVTQETTDNVYLEKRSDETEERDQGTKPELPRPRPETGPQDQDLDYESVEDKKPDHVYLKLLSVVSQGCDQPTLAEDLVEDTKAEDHDIKTPDCLDQEKDIKPQNRGQDNVQ